MSFKRSPAWKVYKEQMSQLDNGDALWEPTPLDYFKRIQIGDVGYIRRACFHLLFSAGKPLGERQLGVDAPLTFDPLDVGPIIHFQSRLPGYLSTDPVRETGTCLEDSTRVVPVLEPGFSVLFESAEKQGAALVTKYSTYREDIQREQNFEEYTKRHYDSWVAFARETGHGNDINPVLVTGVDMTRDFAMMSYSSNGVHLKSEFTVSAPGVSSASAWGTWRTEGLIHTNCGPQPCLPPSATQTTTSVPRATGDIMELVPDYDQCVFVRYYTMRKRPLFAPKLIKAGAGPHDLGPGDRNDGSPCGAQCDSDSENASSLFDNDGSGDRSSVTSIDSEPDVVVRNIIVDESDDFDAIADYVFQNSDANSVIAHHRDLALFRKAGSATTVSPFSVQPSIVVDGNGVGRMNYEADRTTKSEPKDSSDLDEQLKRSTVFNHDIFTDGLDYEQATQATSPGRSTSIPFHSFMASSSPSVHSPSFSSTFSTPLGTLPPDRKDPVWDFSDALQRPGSTDDGFSHHDYRFGVHPDGYPQAPIWDTNLWDNLIVGHITDGQFPARAVATADFGSPYPRPGESSPYNMFRPVSPPLFVDSRDLSSSPTLVDAEGPASTSTPSATTSLSSTRSLRLSRSYTRRARSVSSDEGTGDTDTTQGIPERSQRSRDESRSIPEGSSNEMTPQKPPKPAPSAWQLYFTDFIRRTQENTTKKINVAQAAKEAGQEYANLSVAEKEKYKRMSQVAKDAREMEYAKYLRTLTPEDIKRENSFRIAQRKAGKSRKTNIKDPNAPKKPLSAYFVFLQRIRSDPELVREIFGDETEPAKQSVLAAAKWRSMTDNEREPFLAQARQDKLDYEAAQKLYESSSITYESSIDLGTSPFLSCFGTASPLSPELTSLYLGGSSVSHVKPESIGNGGHGERSSP